MPGPAPEPPAAPAAPGGVGEAAEAVLAGLRPAGPGPGPGAEALAGFERAVAAARAWRGGGTEARAAVERTVAVLEAAAVARDAEIASPAAALGARLLGTLLDGTAVKTRVAGGRRPKPKERASAPLDLCLGPAALPALDRTGVTAQALLPAATARLLRTLAVAGLVPDGGVDDDDEAATLERLLLAAGLGAVTTMTTTAADAEAVERWLRALLELVARRPLCGAEPLLAAVPFPAGGAGSFAEAVRRDPAILVVAREVLHAWGRQSGALLVARARHALVLGGLRALSAAHGVPGGAPPDPTALQVLYPGEDGPAFAQFLCAHAGFGPPIAAGACRACRHLQRALAEGHTPASCAACASLGRVALDFPLAPFPLLCSAALLRSEEQIRGPPGGPPGNGEQEEAEGELALALAAWLLWPDDASRRREAWAALGGLLGRLGGQRLGPAEDWARAWLADAREPALVAAVGPLLARALLPVLLLVAGPVPGPEAEAVAGVVRTQLAAEAPEALGAALDAARLAAAAPERFGKAGAARARALLEATAGERGLGAP